MKEKEMITPFNYTINITFEDIENTIKLEMKKQENSTTILIDSTFTLNGKATFKGNIDFPEVYGIFITDQEQGIFPIVEKGTINIRTNISDLSNTQISGTKLNDQLNKYKDESKKISSQMNEFFHEFQKARSENDDEKLIEINRQMQAINFKKDLHSLNFVRNNPNSFVASMVLYSLVNNNEISKDTIAKLYSKLSKDVKKSEFSKNIAIGLEMYRINKDSLP